MVYYPANCVTIACYFLLGLHCGPVADFFISNHSDFVRNLFMAMKHQVYIVHYCISEKSLVGMVPLELAIWLDLHLLKNFTPNLVNVT